MTTDALRRSLAVNRFWEAASSKEDSVDRGTLDNTKATGQSRIPERKISGRKRGPREPPDYQSVMGKFHVRWTLMRGRGAAETRPTPTRFLAHPCDSDVTQDERATQTFNRGARI